MAKVNLKEASREQVLHFMQTRLNLKGLQPTTSKAKLLLTLKKHYSDQTIEVPEILPEGGDAGPLKDRPHMVDGKGKPAPPVGKVDPLKFALYDPMVRLKIANEKNSKYGTRNVMVSSQGTQYAIPRGREVDVPYRYYAILAEAIGLEYAGWDDELEANQEPIEVESYSVTVTRMPTEEQIEAWKASMKPLLDKQSEKKMQRIMRQREKNDERRAI